MGAVYFLLGLLVGLTFSGLWTAAVDLIAIYREERDK